ncbi:MAG: hypothetical protein HY973_04490 [Candidatus Kerfeldbacteria bacterium]|nr:hypothetical protein [Candidatus Kerfeldbacteria bacterium]
MSKVLAQPDAVMNLRNSLIPFLGEKFLTKIISISNEVATDKSISPRFLAYFKKDGLPCNIYCISVCEKSLNRFSNPDKFKSILKKAVEQNNAIVSLNNNSVVKFFSKEPNDIIQAVSLVVNFKK